MGFIRGKVSKNCVAGHFSCLLCSGICKIFRKAFLIRFCKLSWKLGAAQYLMYIMLYVKEVKGTLKVKKEALVLFEEMV